MDITQKDGDSGASETTPHFVDDAPQGHLLAWEEIETGRFMPRRIRGSYQGRALG
jgi:hypothetical protein